MPISEYSKEIRNGERIWVHRSTGVEMRLFNGGMLESGWFIHIPGKEEFVGCKVRFDDAVALADAEVAKIREAKKRDAK